MILRTLKGRIVRALQSAPVVAILGPRQAGKTTLALEVAKGRLGKEVAYLDLERDSDLAKLGEPEDYLGRFDGKLLIIDEVQRQPDLFRVLRSLVDARKRAGEKAGHFLLLGSASRDLIQHSTETLAGRIRFLELGPFSIPEISRGGLGGPDVDRLWLRGGFPDSYLADSDDESWDWRADFIASYVERDIPQMGPSISAVRMKRLWAMLAHWHGQQVNTSSLGKSLEVTHKTVRSYLDTLTDFYMVRQLPPWSGNTKTRLVKSPKIYVRDTGMLHCLLNIPDHETLLGHPVAGASWEGFVLESIISSLSSKWRYSHYRTASQAEIDLVLEGPRQETVAVEIKRSSSPKVGRSFHRASESVKATRKFVVYSGRDRFALTDDTEAISLHAFLSEID